MEPELPSDCITTDTFAASRFRELGIPYLVPYVNDNLRASFNFVKFSNREIRENERRVKLDGFAVRRSSKHEERNCRLSRFVEKLKNLAPMPNLTLPEHASPKKDNRSQMS